TAMGPDDTPLGTMAVSEAVVPLVTVASRPLNDVRSFAGSGSKFWPVIATDIPGAPAQGAKPVMTGVALITNACALVADPNGVVTLSGPVVAPAGTVATS